MGLANAKYFNKIMELGNLASDDRDSNNITFEEWKELHDVINAVWVKLCQMDQLTKCICCNEEIPLKELKDGYCNECISVCLVSGGVSQ